MRRQRRVLWLVVGISAVAVLAAADSSAIRPVAEEDPAAKIPSQIEPASPAAVPPGDDPSELSPQTLYLPPDAAITPSGDPINRTSISGLSGWRTNWNVRTVSLEQLLDVLARDGIRSLDGPKFEALANGAIWLSDNHPVIELVVSGDARTFPLEIMSAHEIVNTTVGGRVLAVTFCPLCNSATVFDRTILGQPVEFGVSGLLRNSDLIMYDRATETLWQQLTGEAIVGD